MKADLRSVVDEIKQRIKVNDWIASQLLRSGGGGINDRSSVLLQQQLLRACQGEEHLYVLQHSLPVSPAAAEHIAFVSYYKYDSPPKARPSSR